MTRPPFSMPEGNSETGFSLELWDLVATDIGATYKIVRVASFRDMLEMVRNGTVEDADANIS
ncbi:MAG: transporter substrate-binding domain-containing protein, partial [Paracoccaceae bacterium]